MAPLGTRWPYGQPASDAHGQRRADDHAVTDDERRQLALLDVVERSADALLLGDEGLAAGKREVGVGVGEGGEQLGRFGDHVCEGAVGPVAGVGLHQARVLARLQADARGDGVGRFARAQQRAAPQRGEAVAGGALGQLGRLRTAGVVERHFLLALEAALLVVGRLPVARQVDAAGGALGQDRSKRSRFMTLSQAATKSRTNFSPASSLAKTSAQRPQFGVRAEHQIDRRGGPPGLSGPAVTALVEVLARVRLRPLGAHVEQVDEEVVGQASGRSVRTPCCACP